MEAGKCGKVWEAGSSEGARVKGAEADCTVSCRRGGGGCHQLCSSSEPLG